MRGINILRHYLTAAADPSVRGSGWTADVGTSAEKALPRQPVGSRGTLTLSERGGWGCPTLLVSCSWGDRVSSPGVTR